MTLLFILNPKLKKIVLNGNCRNMFKLKSAEIANVVLLFEKKERRIDRHFTIFFCCILQLFSYFHTFDFHFIIY